jgi:hypothetical protein
VGTYGVFGRSVLRDADYWRGVVPVRVRFMPTELFFLKKDLQSKRASAILAGATRHCGDQRDLARCQREAGDSLGTALQEEVGRKFSWRKLGQSVQFMVGYDMVLGKLDAQSFIPEELQQPYEDKNEWVGTRALVLLDFGMIYRAFKP